jgi:hypothetical protein
VAYVNKDTALNAGLAKLIDGKIYLGADNNTVLDSQGLGRRSVRLESFDTFNNGLLVGDFEHMPGNACGIWPSLSVYNLLDNMKLYGMIYKIEETFAN